MDQQRLNLLFEKYQQGALSPAEQEELNDWFHGLNLGKISFDTWLAQAGGEEAYIESRLGNFKARIGQQREVAKSNRLWPRIAAAASVLICLSIGGYFLLHTRQTQQLAQNQPLNIKPGSKKAILTLSSGKQISLNDAMAGTLAKQGNTIVAKTADGQVVYSEEKSNKTESTLVFNTINTPRAGYYPLKLADGTIAILDAESSIKYPVAFTGNERLVEITGQVYFEVAHNSKPFRLKVKGQIIEDLGTHFNVNAYDDETVIRTTLVEGSIRVIKNGSTVIIKPGQQAVTRPTNDEIIIREVNTDDVIAWKNGQTSFKNEDIQEIMRKISRWYDVDIRYEGQIPTRGFDGSISRNANLSDLLKVLEFNNIHFKVEGKIITVKP